MVSMRRRKPPAPPVRSNLLEVSHGVFGQNQHINLQTVPIYWWYQSDHHRPNHHVRRHRPLGFTVKGSVEIVSYFMLFALLAAFAAFVERSQIIVDVFTQKMPQSIKGYLMGLFMLGFFFIGVVFAWGLYESAIDALEFGKVTQDLRISMMPIYAFSAFLSLLLAIRSLIESINIFKTGEFFDAEETGA